MNEFGGFSEVDIVKIKEEIAFSLRRLSCPKIAHTDVWSFLRGISRKMEPVPLVIRETIYTEVEKRIAKLDNGEVIELWLQTDIGRNSDEDLADYIAESAVRRDAIHELANEMINWAAVEVYKEENPDWKQDVLRQQKNRTIPREAMPVYAARRN